MSTTKLQLTMKSSNATKTLTISNPIPADDFDTADVNTFIAKFNDVYDSDVALSAANYITTDKTAVYPEA